MNNAVTVKSANKDSDISIIQALAKEIWTEHYMSIIGQEQVDYMLNKFQSKNAIAAAIQDGYVYYIAYYDNIPCGYSAIKLDNSVFLSKFYVKKPLRGHGLGNAMMSTILAYASDNHAKRIWLTCNKYNEKTLKVYKKLGFSVVDEVVNDIGGGFVMDDFVLEKILL